MNRIAVDDSGNAYLVGNTYCTSFTPKHHLPDKAHCGTCDEAADNDGFVAKFKFTSSPASLSVVYSTLLCGNHGLSLNGIALDKFNNAYLAGETYSSDLPLINSIQGPSGDVDAFIMKLNAAGTSLLYSTYLGGSGGDGAFDIALGPHDNIYVVGYTYSTDFPATQNAFQTQLAGSWDAFIAKISSSGSRIAYASYLGGKDNFDPSGLYNWDAADRIAVDRLGNAYLAGSTCSTDFPLKNPMQNSFGGPAPTEPFVAKVVEPSVFLR